MKRKASEMTDDELVAAAKAGNTGAFDLLVRKYQNRLINLIYRYVKNEETAKECAQESFIKAWRALPNFRGDSAFYTWLYRIGANTAKNHLASSSIRPPSEDIDISEKEYEAANLGMEFYASPEENLMRDELEKFIFEQIDKLPKELKQAIELRELEGMSYEDIAVQMDCPIGTVRSRIFRAREILNKALKKMGVNLRN